MNKVFWIVCIFIFSAALLDSCSCGSDKKSNNSVDTVVKFTVTCDEAIFPLMKSPTSSYDSLVSQAKVNFQRSSALDAMQKLFNGESQVIILARDYTHFEDSIIKVSKVKPYLKYPVAKDALVFYVNYQSDLDSINDNILNKMLTVKNYVLPSEYKKHLQDPIFVTNNYLSSEMVNLKKLVCRNNPLTLKLKVFSTYDSVISYVKTNPKAIGIGYLSQIIHNTDVKPLKISFYDSTNNYIFPHIVHAANIIQKLYPYIVTHYVYIFDSMQEFPLKYVRYLTNPGYPQKYFFDYGIVPANAKFKLIDEG